MQLLRSNRLSRRETHRRSYRAPLWLMAVIVMGGSIAPVVAMGGRACAGEGPRAALVVDFEDQGGALPPMCVALHDLDGNGRVSGLELIRLAHEQFDLQYRLGHGGQAVCQLGGVGYAEEDCLQAGRPFWGYWRGAPGGWSWSGSGANATTVDDGDVEGWAWGRGTDGGSHAQPPETAFSSVCGTRSGEPRSVSRPGGTRRGPLGEGRAAGAGQRSVRQRSRQPFETNVDNPAKVDSTAPDPAPGRRESEGPPAMKRRAKGREGGSLALLRTRQARYPASSSGDTTLPASATAGSDRAGGPPLAGVAGLAAAAALAGAGFVVLRRRRAGGPVGGK